MTRCISIIGLLLALALCDRAALAHAMLQATSPAHGEVLAYAPREIVLRFNEAVTPITLTLVGSTSQSTIPRASIASRDDTIHATVPDDLQPGSYIMSYRVASADSHPISGAFLFAIGAPSSAAPTAPDPRERENAWALLVTLNRIVLLASLLFAAGGVLFAASVLGARAALIAPLRRPLRLGAGIASASAALAIILQGGLLTAAPIDHMAVRSGVAILTVGWHSTLGTSAALIACGMGLVACCFGRGTKPMFIWLSAAGAMLAAGALAASGHAVTAPPRWLAIPAMATHDIAIAFWAGSLWPLLRLLRLPSAPITEIVPRFSRWAVVAVAILVVTGLILALLQLGGDLTALVGTSYGQLLLLKLAIVALLLMLATANKFRLTPALIRGEAARAAARLARAIRLEIVTIGLIVILATLLGQTPPPNRLTALDRSASAFHEGRLHGEHAASVGTSATAMIQAKGYTAVMMVVPARIGRNTVTIMLQGPNGTAFDALAATAEISLPEQGLEPFAEPLQVVSPGRYQLITDGFLRAGLWQLSLGVLIDDFERVTFETPIAIRN